MKILNFIERHLGKIVIGGALATLPPLAYQLNKYSQMREYHNKIIDVSSDVFNKNAYVHYNTENEVKDLSPQEQYNRWKQVNDSLDFEQAKSLVNQLDGALRGKVEKELVSLNAQQAVERLKTVVDSVEKAHVLRIR